jgi:hypothetical protein
MVYGSNENEFKVQSPTAVGAAQSVGVICQVPQPPHSRLQHRLDVRDGGTKNITQRSASASAS